MFVLLVGPRDKISVLLEAYTQMTLVGRASFFHVSDSDSVAYTTVEISKEFRVVVTIQ